MIVGSTKRQRSGRRGRGWVSRGFTLLELVIVIAIAFIVMGIAIPVVQNTLRVYALRSAVSAVTGAISSTRYQAIFHGCKTQVVFTAAAYTYQQATEAPAYGGTGCAAAFSNVTAAALPLPGHGPAIGANITFTFSPGGSVTATPAATPMTMTLTYPGTTLPAEVITVSTYGNVTVAP